MAGGDVGNEGIDGPGRTLDPPFDLAALIDLPPSDLAEAPARTGDVPRWYERISYLVPDLPALESMSPDGRRFASVRAGEIVLREAGEDGVRALTRGVAAECGWEVDGQGADPWSPDQRHLFALHFDRSDVLRVPRVLFRGADASLDWPQQPKAGAALGDARPHLVPLEGAPVALEVGATRDCYFRLFGWSADSSLVWFGRYARDMSRVDIFAAASSTGAARLVLSETSATFLTDVSQVVWGGSTGFTLLGDEGFLWCSERDGWRRLYRHDRHGALVGALTPPGMVVHDVIRVDREARWACASASVEGERRYDVHLFRVPLDAGPLQPLTEGEGVHDVQMDADGLHFVDTWSTPSRPPRRERRSVAGERIGASAEAKIDRLLATGWSAPEEIVVTAADGRTPLHGLLLRPPRFDPSRRYPLVEMVYGGPQMTVVPRRFVPAAGGPEPLLHSLSHAGFLVWVLDARGTPGRDKRFRDAVHRDFADHVVADHALALRELLRTRDCIDVARIGVFGRSWGGYFALRFLLDAPDLYRAGISVVPGFDVFGGMLYEPYLGLPQHDAAPYRAADLYSRAAHLTRPFMMMSGTLDTSTLGDAYRMSIALTQAGVDHANVVFPEQDHVFTGAAAAQHDRLVRDFFARELG